MCDPIRFRTDESPSRCAGTGGFTLVELLIVVVIIASLASLVVVNSGNVSNESDRNIAMIQISNIREALVGSVNSGFLRDMEGLPSFANRPLQNRFRVHDLLSGERFQGSSYDPVTRIGWRGPYLNGGQGAANLAPERAGLFPEWGDLRFPGDKTFLDRGFYASITESPYGEAGDLTVADPWGNPIVIQIPIPAAFSIPSDEKQLRYARVVSAGPDGVLNVQRGDALAGRDEFGVENRKDDLVLFLYRSDHYEANP